MSDVAKTILKVVISIVLVAVAIFLILFIMARAARFESIGSLIEHMILHLSVMWDRITA